jgi:broad specificity phosphatase PhoE
MQPRNLSKFLYVVRHSERTDKVQDPNERAKITYRYDVPITTRGHEWAFKTGEFLLSELEKLRSDGSRSPDAKLVLISSPYYRCIQTTKMIAQAVGAQNIHQQTIFTENAIQEWWNSAEVPKDVQQKRHYANMTESLLLELFSQFTNKHNTLFDYQKNPVLTAKWDEGMNTDCMKRFTAAFGDLTERAALPENLDKVFVCVSHGASIESQEALMDRYKFPNFCGAYLLEKMEPSVNNKLWKVLIENHKAYE